MVFIHLLVLKAANLISHGSSPNQEKTPSIVIQTIAETRSPQRIWSEQKGYQFPVLSDFWPHGAVAKSYGVFNDALGCANRATFIIGEDGKVVDTFASPDLATPRDKSSYQSALKTL